MLRRLLVAASNDIDAVPQRRVVGVVSVENIHDDRLRECEQEIIRFGIDQLCSQRTGLFPG